MSDSISQETLSNSESMGANETSVLDFLQIVADNLRLLVVGPLLIGLIAVGISFIIAPTFTSKVQFIPPKQQQSGAAAALADLGVLGNSAGAVAGIKNPADQYAALVKSKSVADALIDQFNLLERYDEKYRIDTRKELEENTRVVVGGKDGLISIEFDDKDAQISADVANAYVVELRKLLNRVALTESQQRRLFFERLVSETKVNLVNAELALKSSGINSSVVKLSAVASLESISKLRAQISLQEVKLATMLGYLNDTAPEIKLVANELNALKSELRKADKDDETVGGQSDYVNRFREFKYQEALMELYIKQFEVARVDESREGAVIQVVDSADKPEKKSKPKRLMVLVVSVISTEIFLLLFIFIRKSYNDKKNIPNIAIKIAEINRAVKNTYSWSKADHT